MNTKEKNPTEFDPTYIFFAEAKRLIKNFNLQGFKQSHPTLLKAIVNSMMYIRKTQIDEFTKYSDKTTAIIAGQAEYIRSLETKLEKYEQVHGTEE